jgi:rRNA-processing protein FCF1
LPSDGRELLGPPRVLVDANGWFLPTRSGTRLDAEIERLVPGAEVAVPSSVLRELRDLESRGIRDAAVALALAEAALRVPTRLEGDDAVLELAERTRCWVLTADRALARRLLDRGVPVLMPRDRTRLESRLPLTAATSVPATVKKRTRLGGAPAHRRR